MKATQGVVQHIPEGTPPQTHTQRLELLFPTLGESLSRPKHLSV